MTLQALENVGYWHQAHSFVRGDWRRADETSPMCLAKTCHDYDNTRENIREEYLLAIKNIEKQAKLCQ